MALNGFQMRGSTIGIKHCEVSITLRFITPITISVLFQQHRQQHTLPLFRRVVHIFTQIAPRGQRIGDFPCNVWCLSFLVHKDHGIIVLQERFVVFANTVGRDAGHIGAMGVISMTFSCDHDI